MARRNPRQKHRSKVDDGGWSDTSWDPVARWYKRWIGKEGSEYHRKLAIPTVLNLLALNPGEMLLDIGCGTGVLSSYVPPFARYIGVDASPKFIAHARAMYARRATGRAHPVAFLEGDARKLQEVEGVEPGIADAAVFLLSIQDMGPLDEVLAAAAWAVNDTGRIVILMLHPCFRVPRQSGWGWDEQRKLQYRRIDSYLSEMVVPVRPVARGQPGSIKSFHLPLQAYVNGLANHGFRIDRIEEIPPYPGIVRRSPNAKAENKANQEIPVFLGLRARRG